MFYTQCPDELVYSKEFLHATKLLGNISNTKSCASLLSTCCSALALALAPLRIFPLLLLLLWPLLPLLLLAAAAVAAAARLVPGTKGMEAGFRVLDVDADVAVKRATGSAFDRTGKDRWKNNVYAELNFFSLPGVPLPHAFEPELSIFQKNLNFSLK